jgi:hypothetical protein
LYAATVNDAKIMEDVFENDVNLRELIKPDDILIADRGFRDCIKIVKERYKINVIIPPCTFFSKIQNNSILIKGVEKQQKQLKQSEADNSRLVTKVRWVVESRNSHLKNFKALCETANQCLPHILNDYRIRHNQLFFPKALH